MFAYMKQGSFLRAALNLVLCAMAIFYSKFVFRKISLLEFYKKKNIIEKAVNNEMFIGLCLKVKFF